MSSERMSHGRSGGAVWFWLLAAIPVVALAFAQIGRAQEENNANATGEPVQMTPEEIEAARREAERIIQEAHAQEAAMQQNGAELPPELPAEPQPEVPVADVPAAPQVDENGNASPEEQPTRRPGYNRPPRSLRAGGRNRPQQLTPAPPADEVPAAAEPVPEPPAPVEPPPAEPPTRTEVNIGEPLDIPMPAEQLQEVSDEELNRLAEEAKRSAERKKADGSTSKPASQPEGASSPPGKSTSSEPGQPVVPDTRTGRPRLDMKELGKYWQVPPGERPYIINWNKTPCDKVCQDIEEMTGLSIFGLDLLADSMKPPGVPAITFQSNELMNFDQFLLTVNMLFFERQYWLLKQNDYLVIRGVSDWYRYISPDRRYDSLEAYRKANLPAWELVSMIVVPGEASPETLAQMVTDIVPLNAARANVVPGTNWINLIGFVHFIEQQLDYIERFDVTPDRYRLYRIYPLKYVEAQDAAVMLQAMLTTPGIEMPAAPTPAPTPTPRSRSRRGSAAAPAAPAMVSTGESATDIVDIHPDDRNDRLVIKATAAKHDEVKRYLTEFIDLPPEENLAEFLSVKHRDPHELVEIITQLIGRLEWRNVPVQQPKPAPGQPPQPPQPMPTVRTRTASTKAVMLPVPSMSAILVKAGAADMSLIKKYLAMLDVPQGEPPYQIHRLQHAEAGSMVMILNSVISARTGRTTRTGVEPFNAFENFNDNKVVILKGGSEDIQQAKTLIEQLDKPKLQNAIERVVELVNAAPEGVIEMLTTRFGGSAQGMSSPRYYGRRSYSPPMSSGSQLPQFLPIQDTKKFIVICEEPMWPDIERFIKQIDETSLVERTNRIYRLKHADVTTVANIVREAFDLRSPNRYGPMPQSGGAMIQYAPEQDMLIVSATDAEHENIAKLITELDQPGPQGAREMREIRLAAADVTYVRDKALEIFGQGSGGSRRQRYSYGAPDTSPQIVAEPVSNRLLVTANDEDFKKIEDLAKQLDQDYQANKFERKMFRLNYANASMIQGAIESMFTQGGGRRSYGYGYGSSSEPGAIKISAIADSLMVYAPADKMTEIEKVIAQLDSSPTQDNEMRTYKIEGADSYAAGNLASTLQRMYGQGPGGGSSSAIQFYSVPGSSLLMVSAPAERMEEVDKRVSELLKAQQSVDLSFVIQNFDVRNARPQDLADMITPVLESKYRELQSSSGRGYYYYGSGPQVMAHRNADKIMVSAPAQMMELVDTLVKEFDQPSQPATMRFVNLETAKAEDVVPAVQQMIAGQEASGGYSSYRFRRSYSPYSSYASSSGTTDDTLQVTQVGKSNTIVLRGPEEKVFAAEKFIKELDDQAEPEGPVIKVLEIKYADVYEVVDMIETMMGVAPAGYGLTRRPTGAGEVVIKSDYYSNRIFVSAPREKMPMIEQIVEMREALARAATEDVEAKTGEGVLVSRDKYGDMRSFDIPEKNKDGKTIDLQQLGKTLDEQLVDYYGYSAAPWVKSFPYASQLIITGKPEQFKMVNDLLKKMIDNPPKSPIVMRTFRVKGVAPERVVTELQAAAPASLQDKINVERVPGRYQSEDPMNLIEEIRYTDPIIKQASKEEGTPFVPPNTSRALMDSLAVVSWAQGARISVAGGTATQPASTATQPATAVPSVVEVKKSEPVASVPRNTPPQQPSQEQLAANAVRQAAVDAYTSSRTEIRYDPDSDMIYVVGPASQLEEIEDLMDDIIKQYEKAEEEIGTEIRVIKVRYLDVTVAASILEEMFNDKQAAAAAQQAAPRGRQQQPPTKQPTKPGAEGEGETTIRDRMNREQEEEAAAKAAAKAAAAGQRIRVVPDPRMRTLIIRAATQDFPLIAELLLKIDRPGGPERNIKTFRLRKLDAQEVEKSLKVILGIDQRDRLQMMPRMGGAGGGNMFQQAAMIEMLQQQMLEMASDTGEDGAKINPAKDISITSEVRTNSILVSAPDEGIALVEKLINELEDMVEDKTRPRQIPLKFASATSVAKTLKDMFVTDKTMERQVNITGDDSSNMLFVTASDALFKDISEVIEVLDRQGSQMTEVITLQYAMATDVETSLKTMAAQLLGKTGLSQEAFAFTADPRTNSLVVVGSPKALLVVKTVLAKIDIPGSDTSTPTTVMISLTRSRATDVANSINAIYRAQRPSGGVPPPSAVAEPNSNVVYIYGTKRQIEEIKASIITPLEEFKPAADLELADYQIPIKHANVDDVANTLMQYFAKRSASLISSGITGETPADKVIAIQPDAASRQLFVKCNAKNRTLIDELLKTMDIEGITQAVRQVKIFPLSYTHPQYVATAIQTVFPQRANMSESERIQVAGEWNTMTLIVSANEENMKKIEELVTKLDSAETAKGQEKETKVFQLKYANPAYVSQAITNTFYSVRTTPPAEQVMVTADYQNMMVIVNANEKNMAKVEQLIAQMDSEEVAKGAERDTKVFQLKYANPAYVHQAIVSKFTTPGRTDPPSEQVAVAPDYQNMAIVITANTKNMTKVEELIAEMDKEPAVGSNQKVIKLQYAQADELARALTQVAYGMSLRNRQGAMPIVITADASSNSLVVSAAASDMKAIESMVVELDKPATDTLQEIRIIPLEVMDVADAQKFLTDYLRKPGVAGSRAGAELIGNVKISISQTMNSLMVSGATAELDRIEQIVRDMDKQDIAGSSTPRTIKLTNASASQVATSLTRIFTEPAQKDRRSQQNPEMVPTIIPDESTNSLVIRARPNDFKMIEEMAQQLDTKPDGPAGVRVVRVARGVDVSGLARELETTINRGETLKAQQNPGYKAAQIAIGVNERVPALIIGGAPELFETVEQLIEQFQTMRGVQESPPKAMVVPLRNSNMSARDMQQILQSIIDQQQGTSTTTGGTGAYRGRTTGGTRGRTR